MSNKAFKPITIHPKAVYITSSGAIEVMANVELNQQDVECLVQTVIAADIYNPVFLITSGGHKQRISFDELSIILAVPLAARRAQIAIEQAAEAARKEKEWQEIEALRTQQAAAEAVKEAANKPIPEPAIG